MANYETQYKRGFLYADIDGDIDTVIANLQSCKVDFEDKGGRNAQCHIDCDEISIVFEYPESDKEKNDRIQRELEHEKVQDQLNQEREQEERDSQTRLLHDLAEKLGYSLAKGLDD